MDSMHAAATLCAPPGVESLVILPESARLARNARKPGGAAGLSRVQRRRGMAWGDAVKCQSGPQNRKHPAVLVRGDGA